MLILIKSSVGNEKGGDEKMKLDKRGKANLSKYLMYAAVVSVILAAEGWIGPDIWLAATQWLLVSLVLLVFAIYLKLT